MNFSRQALLGIGMILGGSVMLYAMVQQIGTSDELTTEPVRVEQVAAAQVTSAPLTTDIDTEKRILAQKQKERAIRVAEQEKRAEQFLTEQETAETQALAKARAENQRYIDNTTPDVVDVSDSSSSEGAQSTVTTPKVQPRVATSTNSTVNKDEQQIIKQAEAKQQAEAKKLEDIAKKTADLKRKADVQLAAEKKAAAQKKEEKQVKAKQKATKEAEKEAETAKKEPPKSATDYTVKSGDGLIKLAREYNVPVAALAQANNTSPSASLQVGQTLVIPSRKQIQRLEREAAAAKKAEEEKRNKEQAEAKKSNDAKQKLAAARKEVKETDAKGSFGVQVALATNQSKADEVAKKYKAAGYQVKTINVGTGRGVRVIVGPERGKIAALALKDKVNSDSSVNATDAWVRYWD